MSNSGIWAETTPDYVKELNAKVRYDKDANPREIRLAENQLRRGKFIMEGDTAVYEPHNLPTIREAGEQEQELVEKLPFVQDIDMTGSEI